MIQILLISDIIIGICLWILFSAIAINFIIYGHTKLLIKKKKKSIVETGSMLLFFFFFYILIRFDIGLVIINQNLNLLLIIIGLFMVIVGCIFNVIGRLDLGHNWGNQVIIYNNHELVESGLYKIVRHPLYSSIIMMFYGASLVHSNIYTILLTSFIFIPFMYYRAKQEEKELSKVFKDYKFYQNRVGMFFPKLLK